MRRYLWMVFSLALTGCAGMESQPESGSILLVTVPQQQFQRAAPPLGSSQGYRAGDHWMAPLAVRETLRALRRDHELIEVDGWPIASLGRYCAVFRVDDDRELASVIDRLRGDERVVDAQAMNEFVGLLDDSYDDPHFELQYGSNAAALLALHHLSTGRGVRIGIIDTLVDQDHPDLQGQIHRQHRFADARPGVHGTAVAGIIAASVNNGRGIVGFSPDAHIEVFGACSEYDGRARCNSFNLARAIETALEQNMEVLNLSLAGPHDRLLADLLAVAVQRGTLVVASRDDSAGGGFPAALPGVIGVATSLDTAQWFRRDEQLSTQAGGGYRFFHGSSVAAAAVSGLTSLVRAESSAPQTRGVVEALMGQECGDPRSAAADFQRALFAQSCNVQYVGFNQ